MNNKSPIQVIDNREKPSELFKSGKMQWEQKKLFRYEQGKIVGCCLIGILEYAGYLDIGADHISDGDIRVANMCNHLGRLGYRQITDWNDVPERTIEEVITMLEQFGL